MGHEGIKVYHEPKTNMEQAGKSTLARMVKE